MWNVFDFLGYCTDSWAAGHWLQIHWYLTWRVPLKDGTLTRSCYHLSGTVDYNYPVSKFVGTCICSILLCISKFCIALLLLLSPSVPILYSSTLSLTRVIPHQSCHLTLTPRSKCIYLKAVSTSSVGTVRYRRHSASFGVVSKSKLLSLDEDDIGTEMSCIHRGALT